MLEEARRNRLLGGALEARVQLHVELPHLADSLASWNDLPNGIDPLRYAFIVSQVRCWLLGSRREPAKSMRMLALSR